MTKVYPQNTVDSVPTQHNREHQKDVVTIPSIDGVFHRDAILAIVRLMIRMSDEAVVKAVFKKSPQLLIADLHGAAIFAAHLKETQGIPSEKIETRAKTILMAEAFDHNIVRESLSKKPRTGNRGFQFLRVGQRGTKGATSCKN